MCRFVVTVWWYNVDRVSGGDSVDRTANAGSTAGYAGSSVTYGGAQAPDPGKHNPHHGTIGYRVNNPR